MNNFKPEYDKKAIIGYVIAALLCISSIYFFIDSHYKKLEFLALPILMVIFVLVYTKGMVIKSIEFNDVICVKRYLWRDVIIRYEDIKYITFAELKAGKRTVWLQNIINVEQLLEILGKKIEEGKIVIDNNENQKMADKQYVNIIFGTILFLVLAVIQLISRAIEKHVFNSIIDGFIVWGIIYCISWFILNKKIKF